MLGVEVRELGGLGAWIGGGVKKRSCVGEPMSFWTTSLKSILLYCKLVVDAAIAVAVAVVAAVFVIVESVVVIMGDWD